MSKCVNQSFLIAGAASLLGKQLAEALLWFGCRHHVSELHMVWADEAVRHAQQPGGEDPLFKRFQKFFDYLDLDNLKFWQPDRADNAWFTEQAEVVRSFAEDMNINQRWIREDYQEMEELLIVYFKGERVVERRGTTGGVYTHNWHMERPGNN